MLGHTSAHRMSQSMGRADKDMGTAEGSGVDHLRVGREPENEPSRRVQHMSQFEKRRSGQRTCQGQWGLTHWTGPDFPFMQSLLSRLLDMLRRWMT